MEGIHIAAFCSAALVLVLVILAAIAVYVRRKHPNWLSSSSASSTTSSPTILTPEITPKFIIPAYYAAAQEEHDEGKSGGGSSVEAGSFDGELRGPPIERSYSMPAKRTRGDSSQTTDDLTAMAARLYRPQYRRAMSSYVGASPGRRRKISVAPSGKLLVTLSFDAAKTFIEFAGHRGKANCLLKDLRPLHDQHVEASAARKHSDCVSDNVFPWVCKQILFCTEFVLWLFFFCSSARGAFSRNPFTAKFNKYLLPTF